MALDARVCCNMADLGKERTKCLMTDMNNFQTTQFTRNVVTFYVYVLKILIYVYISDAAGSVLNRKTEPKCLEPNRLFF